MSDTSRLRQQVAALSRRVGILEIKVARGITSGGGGSGGYDDDSNAGFVAGGITDSIIKDAIDTLIVGLKANSLWTKVKCLYPLAGGTTLSNSINFKTPGTGNLSIHPSATVHAGGLQGNSGPIVATANGITTDYVATISSSIGLYSNTNVPVAISDFIASDGVTYWNMHLQWTDGNSYADCYQVAGGRINGAVASSVGHYYMSRIGNEMWFAKNNAAIGTGYNNNPSYGVLNGIAFQIGSYSPRNYGFWWVADGLYPAELAIMNSLVQGYLIAMGR